MKFFVTGASGFVGRHLVHTLIQSGDSVVALSRSATSDEKLQQAAAAGPAEKRLLSAKGKSSPDGIVGTLTIVRGDLKSKAAILQGEWLSLVTSAVCYKSRSSTPVHQKPRQYGFACLLVSSWYAAYLMHGYR